MQITQRDKALFAKARRQSERSEEQRMRLGRGDAAQTLFVPGRKGFVYARPLIPSTATASQVRCRDIIPAYGLPVIVRPGIDGILEVVRADPRLEAAYAGDTGMNFNMPVHGANHGVNGADPVFLSSKQHLPFATMPTTPASTSVYVYPMWYFDTDGDRQYFAGGSINLADEIAALAANEQQLVVIALNRATGTLTKTAGTAATITGESLYAMPFSFADANAIAIGANERASQAVRIYNGQTAIQIYDMPDRFDLRYAQPILDADIPDALTISGGSTIVVKDVNLTIQDDADPTKQGQFDLSEVTAGTTPVVLWPKRNTGLVIKTPGASTDNIIQPSGDFIPLVVKGNASQTANLQEWQNSASSNLVSISASGAITAADTISVNKTTASAVVLLNADAGQVKFLQFRSANSARWQFGSNAAAESGSNAGSDFVITRFSDAAANLGNPIAITRATGNTALETGTALTSSTNDNLIIRHNTTGTPAAGFGSRIRFQGESSAALNRDMLDITYTWVTATDASRAGRAVLNAWDTAARECLRMEASGTAAMIGFLGASAIARYSTTGTTTGFTAGAGTGVRDDSTFTGNTGATAYTIGDIVRALKQYGLLTS